MGGTGHIEADLAAVRGYQSQYRFSHSGWGTSAGIDGGIELPLTAAPDEKTKGKAVAGSERGAKPGAL